MPFLLRLIAATLLLSCWGLPALAQAPVRVEQAVSRSVLQEMTASGTVTSLRSAVLSSQVSGLVHAVAVDEGHRVQAGETLIELDAELAELALARAQAQLRQQQIALDDARRRLAEAQKVGASQAIARTQIASLEAEVAGSEAGLTAQQVAVKEQEARVRRHRVLAPYDGLISQRDAELGEWVNPGDPLLQLIAMDELRFDFRVNQSYSGALEIGTPVRIAVDALGGQEITGRVTAVVPVNDPAVRTFLVRAVSDEASPALAVAPGMSVSGSFQLDTRQSGVVVPRDAILRYPDGRITVWVVDPQSLTASEKAVEIGLEFEGLVEVKRGIARGDRVVTRGNESLREGQAVSLAGQGSG